MLFYLSLSSLSRMVYLIEYIGYSRGPFFLDESLADNNKALLDQISKLVADSADNFRRASVQAADEQLREIKRLRREPDNELLCKFNAKL